ncbi:MAG: glycoside hydrolase [Acidobacteriota bacterium]|nr:glycoside hydrolase [Acidobacteriota bacterium]
MKSLLLIVALALPAFGELIPNPSGLGSLQASWSVTKDGSPLLSWIETEKDDSYTLKYAIRHGAAWTEPRTIAAHRQFFRHPAELPEVISLSEGTLVAHWVESPDDGSDTEFSYVSVAHDGLKWSVPVIIHKDRSKVQHGLASIAASSDGEASILWLEALQGEDGPVSLKRTVVSSAGKVLKEENLDNDVCTCCPTSVVKTARGLLVAYRDHTPQDIRDISVMRLEGGKWTAPRNINPDNWKINACPTNAAAAAAKGDKVAIAWYTGAGNMPREQIVFSSDGGTTFSKPVLLSTGRSFGYTSIALDEQGAALVSWLEAGGEDARILLRRISAAGVAGPVVQVAQGSRKSLGYPRILQTGNETLVAWTSSNTSAKVQTARVGK